MNARRGFLALVGGGFVTGAVGRTKAATPTSAPAAPELVTSSATLLTRNPWQAVKRITEVFEAVVRAGLPDEACS